MVAGSDTGREQRFPGGWSPRFPSDGAFAVFASHRLSTTSSTYEYRALEQAANKNAAGAGRVAARDRRRNE